MGNGAAPHRYRRLALGLAIALVSAVAAISSAATAAAETPVNGTPEQAVTFFSLPYQGSAGALSDAPAAADPAAQRVAAACNSGAAIYGAAWWRYTAPERTTFVVHAANFTNAVGERYEPIGLAVVAGDLGTVQTCGKAVSGISDAGAVTIDRGESLYVATFLTRPADTMYFPVIGVYPSTGSTPTNDSYSSPMQITSLPFSATHDTTLATRESSEPSCYSKFGHGPSVWYSLTATSSELLDITTTSDYQSDLVIVPGTGAPSTSWLCGVQQFEAEAGVTYLIGIYGFDELRNAGRLTVKVSAAPAPPTVQLTIAPTGTVNKKTGTVRLSGAVTCTGANTTHSVIGTVKQVQKRVVRQQSFSGTSAACTTEPASWTATATPSTFKFAGGDALIAASVEACNDRGCTTATAERTVKLKVG